MQEVQIRLYLMGSLKQKFVSQDYPGKNCYMEVNERATPEDLLRFLGIGNVNILALINGKPVDLKEQFSDGDRVVLMDPQTGGE